MIFRVFSLVIVFDIFLPKPWRFQEAWAASTGSKASNLGFYVCLLELEKSLFVAHCNLDRSLLSSSFFSQARVQEVVVGLKFAIALPLPSGNSRSFLFS